MTAQEIILKALTSKKSMTPKALAQALDKGGKMSSPQNLFVVISPRRKNGHKIASNRKDGMVVSYTYEGMHAKEAKASGARADLIEIAQTLSVLHKRTKAALKALPKAA